MKDRNKWAVYKIKANWYQGANMILDKYGNSNMAQAQLFMAFCQWDRG